MLLVEFIKGGRRRSIKCTRGYKVFIIDMQFKK